MGRTVEVTMSFLRTRWLARLGASSQGTVSQVAVPSLRIPPISMYSKVLVFSMDSSGPRARSIPAQGSALGPVGISDRAPSGRSKTAAAGMGRPFRA